MKFAKMFSIILVAIFSLAMSSANADLCRLNDAGDKCVDQPLQTVKNVGCATVNSVEVCNGEKVYNTPPAYSYTQPSRQIIYVNYVPVVVDPNLADRAWNYINVTCPKYASTSYVASFIADMSAIQFNGFSIESQMFLSACNAR